VGYDAEDLACFTAHRFARISPAPDREISARAVTRSADPRRCGKLANHRDRSITLPVTTKLRRKSVCAEQQSESSPAEWPRSYS
jgi:hypothetical protein